MKDGLKSKIIRSIAYRVAFWSMILMCIQLSQSMQAQVLYGTLVGGVKDSTGAMVPGATVTIVQQETKDTRTATTNSDGTYTLSTVPTGTYAITITKAGFKAFVARDVEVSLNTEVRVDAALEVGQASQSVSVTADEALIQTDRADVHEQLSSKSLESLPQPTRIYEGLIGLMPGVAPPTAFTGVTNDPMRSMQIHANGTNGSGTLVRIDGVSSQNPFVQYFSTAVPSVEAIQTVNVVTASSGADQGMADGAAINVQIKSGTNQFHGSAYFYQISNLFAAKPYFLPAGHRLTKLIDSDTGGTRLAAQSSETNSSSSPATKVISCITEMPTWSPFLRKLFEQELRLARPRRSMIRQLEMRTEPEEHLFRGTSFQRIGSVRSVRWLWRSFHNRTSREPA
jgi:hypothetical protein